MVKNEKEEHIPSWGGVYESNDLLTEYVENDAEKCSIHFAA